MLTATRYHDFSMGHRVSGHENKCASLHGHNYRVHFTCIQKENRNGMDNIGRVVDFSVIKERLCDWLEQNWDHKFLLWCGDDYRFAMSDLPGVILVPFNPTAENMAIYLQQEIGPLQLEGTGVNLVSVMIEETVKCSARFTNVD